MCIANGLKPSCRVLIVYGSESGNSKRAIQRIAKNWSAREEKCAFDVVDIVAGNSIHSLTDLSSKADVILIATSSFGEGDPPENFSKLLLKLLLATQAGETPLAGMQHAVLGFGASVYETFQNTPRLADKMLEECGSRRMVRRAEIDETSEADPLIEMKRFEEEVFQTMQKLPSPSAAPVCKWTEPEGKILPKTAIDLDMYGGSDGSNVILKVVVVSTVVIGIAAGFAKQWEWPF